MENEILPINKSADSLPEFLGVKGKYLKQLIIIGFIEFIVFLILSSILSDTMDNHLLSTLISLAFLVITLVGFYTYLKKVSNRYGEGGLGKISAVKKHPRFLKNSEFTWNNLKKNG